MGIIIQDKNTVLCPDISILTPLHYTLTIHRSLSDILVFFYSTELNSLNQKIELTFEYFRGVISYKFEASLTLQKDLE